MHFVPYRVTGDARADQGHQLGRDQGDLCRRHDRFHFRDLPAGLTRPHHRPLGTVSGRSERRIKSAVHGTHQHGAYLPYQIGSMRPIPELGSYRSPIAYVYLCGAGSHPGSGVTMAPGRNAARVICADLGLAFPQ